MYVYVYRVCVVGTARLPTVVLHAVTFSSAVSANQYAGRVRLEFLDSTVEATASFDLSQAAQSELVFDGTSVAGGVTQTAPIVRMSYVTACVVCGVWCVVSRC